jgi:hypothetical protein
MKIALCLFGNVGHQLCQGERKQKKGHDPFEEAFKPKGKGWTNPTLGANAFKKHVMGGHDVDVFLHSWSVDYKQELLDIYKPVDHEIVVQTQFGSDLAKYGLVGTDMSKWEMSEFAKKSYDLLLPSRGSAQAIIDELRELSFRTESRWWSNKRVLELAKAHEAKHGIEYDFILVSRFDNVFTTPLPFSDLDPTKFYGSRRFGRPDENYSYFDYWFVSGSENMGKFAGLYDNRFNYSIRPTFACREHVVQTMGVDAVAFLFKNAKDYLLGTR